MVTPHAVEPVGYCTSARPNHNERRKVASIAIFSHARVPAPRIQHAMANYKALIHHRGRLQAENRSGQIITIGPWIIIRLKKDYAMISSIDKKIKSLEYNTVRRNRKTNVSPRRLDAVSDFKIAMHFSSTFSFPSPSSRCSASGPPFPCFPSPFQPNRLLIYPYLII